MPPAAIAQRLKALYPKPSIDAEWLDACYGWVLEEYGLAPNDTDAIVTHVNTQFLASDLTDSTIPGTGLPQNVANLEDGRIATGGAILVQIIAITDIGNSAFSLQNVRHTRIEKMDMAGLGEDVEEGRIPNYPRSMLRLELSDGLITLQAFEYRRLPVLELGVTPLGSKLLLKNVPVRRGYAFLEPANVTVIPNSQVDELEQGQDAAFVKGLRFRLGLQDADPEATLVNQDPPPGPPSPPPQGIAQAAPAPIEIDSPPRAASPPPQAARNDGAVRSNYFANPPPRNNPSTTQTLPKVEPVHLNAAFNTNPPRAAASSAADESFDFDEFDNLGEDVLEAVEAMELEAMQGNPNAVVTATSSRVTQSQSSTRAGASTLVASTAVASGSRAGGKRIAVKQEVITLDDDDDDDKENVFWKSPPVTQRRRNARPPPDEEVIEISD